MDRATGLFLKPSGTDFPFVRTQVPRMFVINARNFCVTVFLRDAGRYKAIPLRQDSAAAIALFPSLATP